MATAITIPNAALNGGKLFEVAQFKKQLGDEIRDRGLGIPGIRITLRPTVWRKTEDLDIEIVTFDLMKLEVIIP